MLRGMLSLLVTAAVVLNPIEDHQPQLELKRTTVYCCGEVTATGRNVRYGYVAYKPEYYHKTCILYTQDMDYIGIFECEDTGGDLVKSGQRIDVYCPSLEACNEWIEQYGDYCYVQWVDAEG